MPGRGEVLLLLAERDSRPATERGEQMDSLDLAWLLHVVEERYGVLLDPTDEELERMSTVSGAVEVLRRLMARGRRAGA